MEYSIALPKAQAPVTIRDLLEKEWLVPRKVRHFLRTRKNVRLNDQPVMFHELASGGDHITLKFEETDYQKPNIALGDKRIVVPLYEDEHLIIVNKPAGIKTHPNQPGEASSLLNHLADYLADENLCPYVVHRLDKETSGAILFAKNPFVLPILSRMLEKKQIKRTYQAIAEGRIAQDLTIDKKIGRDRHDRRKRIIDPKNGKQAITHVKAVTSGRTSQILCRLDTGRTHQIRVHLASIGHPIAGDPLYHPKPGKSRLQLHAFELELMHPFTKEEVKVLAEPGLW